MGWISWALHGLLGALHGHGLHGLLALHGHGLHGHGLHGGLALHGLGLHWLGGCPSGMLLHGLAGHCLYGFHGIGGWLGHGSQ